MISMIFMVFMVFTVFTFYTAKWPIFTAIVFFTATHAITGPNAYPTNDLFFHGQMVLKEEEASSKQGALEGSQAAQEVTGEGSEASQGRKGQEDP